MDFIKWVVLLRTRKNGQKHSADTVTRRKMKWKYDDRKTRTSERFKTGRSSLKPVTTQLPSNLSMLLTASVSTSPSKPHRLLTSWRVTCPEFIRCRPVDGNTSDSLHFLFINMFELRFRFASDLLETHRVFLFSARTREQESLIKWGGCLFYTNTPFPPFTRYSMMEAFKMEA